MPASPAADSTGVVTRHGAATTATVDPVALLPRLRDELAARIGADRFNRDLHDGAGLTLEPGALVVRVSSQAAREVLQKRYEGILSAAASAQGLRVDYRVQAPAAQSMQPTTAPRAQSQQVPAAQRPGLSAFITGPGNRLAHDAAVAVAEGRLAAGVPLVVFGTCGVGKTHLLQAMVDATLARRPGAQAKFIAAEAFMSEFGLACRDNRTEGFRKKLRCLDLLCLDDLQSLAHKQGMQQELQHTIDAIRDRGGRVVMAALTHPRKLEGFSDALVSRLAGGMVAEIQAPDAITAGKIVWALAQKRGLTMDENVARAIAESAAAQLRTGTSLSVRDLEGAVTKVEAVHRLLGSHVTGNQVSGATHADAPSARIGMIAVQRALGSQGAPGGVTSSPTMAGVVARIGPRRPVLVDQVVALVCDRLRVTMVELSGKGRHHRVVLARALATTLARRCTSASYPEIARAIGRPNHSTVITAHQRLAEQIAANAQVDAGDGQPVPLNALIEELAVRLTGSTSSVKTA